MFSTHHTHDFSQWSQDYPENTIIPSDEYSPYSLVSFVKVYMDAKEPSRGSNLSAGYDLRAYLPLNDEGKRELTIHPGNVKMVGTGVRSQFNVAESDSRDILLSLNIQPRSGLAAKHGITVINTPGLVDADYENELMVLIVNHGKEAFTIEHGDRIAQATITLNLHPSKVAGWVIGFDPTHSRGLSGMGSTGVK